MATGETHRIAHDLLSEPHIRGRRVSVRQIAALVESRDVAPESVADRYDLDIADVYRALAYYHENPREMSSIENEREATFEALQETVTRPDGVDPEND